MAATAFTNHQIRLAARPVGLPTAANWQATEEPVSDPAEGGVLVKVLALSLDPAMRGWMNEGKSYIRPVEIGEVMRAGGVGRVVASRSPAFAAGDLVAGTFGVQEYWSVSGEQLPKSGLHKIDPRLGSTTQWLNVLGMPGMTAYFGLLDVGQPKARRHGGGFGRRRRGGTDRGPAGQDQRLPRGGHRRRPCQVRLGRQGARLRRLHRLQGAGAGRRGALGCGARRAQAALPERRRRLLRQRRRADPRRGAGAHQPQGAHRDLRRDRAVQRHQRHSGSEELHVAAGQPRAHGGHGGVRLCRAFSAGGGRTGGVPERRPHQEQGRRRARRRAAFPATLLKLFSGENFGKLVLQVADE